MTNEWLDWPDGQEGRSVRVKSADRADGMFSLAGAVTAGQHAPSVRHVSR
jgi:hypothetical protein